MPSLVNIGTLATCQRDGRQSEIHLLHDAAVAWRAGKITWVGSSAALPPEYHAEEQYDAHKQLVIPGLIDCHTHLAFAGWRAEEFVERIKGKSYLEIAREGGGILSTMRLTREATKEKLTERALEFLADIAALGVTTVECKSGYGLSVESEIKLLQVYAELSKRQALTLVPTLLAAHSIPPEFRENRRGYLELIMKELIPQVAAARFAKFCDAFVEEGAFSVAEAKELLLCAAQHGLLPTAHIDQFTSSGAARLAAETKCVSMSHLERTPKEELSRLAEAKAIAVLLPFAALFTQQAAPNGRLFIDAGVPVALATDFNPGSAPCFHLPLAMSLGCTLLKMTPSEALKGATIVAAEALALEDERGSIEVGKAADLAVFDAPSVENWLYHFRERACTATIKDGAVIAGTLAN